MHVYRVQFTDKKLTTQLGVYSNINKAVAVADSHLRGKKMSTASWVFSYDRANGTIRMYAASEDHKCEAGIISWEVR